MGYRRYHGLAFEMALARHLGAGYGRRLPVSCLRCFAMLNHFSCECGNMSLYRFGTAN